MTLDANDFLHSSLLMDKYKFNPQTSRFEIDPAHLAEGLAAAKKDGRLSVGVRALDSRIKDLTFDTSALAAQTWIRKLFLARDLKPDAKTGAWLELLTALEELTTTEWGPVDYKVFTHLKELVLFKGKSLEGLDKIKSLDSVYLAFWDTEALPDVVARLAATRLRISASRKLKDITAAFEMKHLTSLTLQDLPKLEIAQKTLELDRLAFLNVEKTGWTDFSPLHSKSLRDLELFGDFQSLKFISQLDNLESVHIWNCLDGDMNPALRHPTLKSISFDKDRKHYTHKEEELEALMKGKRG